MSKRLLLPVGGWCGPALILGKLGLRDKAFPFDFSRVTLDGVIRFVHNGFAEGFFPPGPRPYRPECVGIWVLFRGQHTAFAHFDLNDSKIHDAFKRKIERWDSALDGNEGPITFFRTVTARDPREELAMVPLFNAAIAERNPNLDFRTVVAVHDQGLDRTTRLRNIDERTQLWALEYTEDGSKTLFDRSQTGYAEIVTTAIDESSWAPGKLEPTSADEAPLWAPHRFARAGSVVAADTKQAETCGEAAESTASLMTLENAGLEVGGRLDPALLDAARFPWRCHNNLALIQGVASVGGTCRGIGSTFAKKRADGLPTCAFCSNDNFHRADKPFRTDRPFTDEEDELLLVHLYKILTGGDKVEAVEQLAHEMNRGAFEVICRIQFLTNSSTKITEGLDMSGDDG